MRLNVKGSGMCACQKVMCIIPQLQTPRLVLTAGGVSYPSKSHTKYQSWAVGQYVLEGKLGE